MQKGDKVKVKLIDGRVVDAVVTSPDKYTQGAIRHHNVESINPHGLESLIAIEGREVIHNWECEIVTK